MKAPVINFPEGIYYELDHIGIAVSSLEEASAAYLAMGWPKSKIEEVLSEKVRVQMFELGNSCRIELLEATSADSIIAKFVKNRGPGLHHICLRVKDIQATLKKLKQNGIKLIHETPFQGAHNCKVAFIHPKSMGGVLFELSEPSGGGPQ